MVLSADFAVCTAPRFLKSHCGNFDAMPFYFNAARQQQLQHEVMKWIIKFLCFLHRKSIWWRNWNWEFKTWRRLVKSSFNSKAKRQQNSLNEWTTTTTHESIVSVALPVFNWETRIRDSTIQVHDHDLRNSNSNTVGIFTPKFYSPFMKIHLLNICLFATRPDASCHSIWMK